MGDRIYEYGLRPPTDEVDRVWEQLWLAHKYRNTLVEIERKRRVDIRAIMATYPDIARLQDELAQLQVQREGLVEQVKAIKAQLRTKALPETAALRAELAALGKVRKVTREELKLAKKALVDDPAAQAAFTVVDEGAHAQTLAARAASGVFWGTYLLVEAAMEAARKSKMDPGFVHWEGGGRLGIQIQGGAQADELATSVYCRVLAAPPPRSAWTHAAPPRATNHQNGWRSTMRRTLQVRIGSDGRAPIFATWPMMMHRPIPPEATIKHVTVICRRVGQRVEWRVLFSLSFPEPEVERTPAADAEWAFTAKACALNLGWCQMPGGLRAGYVVTSDGREEEIFLPQALLDRVTKADSIKSIRDTNLTTMQAALSAWLVTNAWPTTPPGAPRGLAERGAHLGLWRSPARFTALARYWRANRFSGDDLGYALLEAWRYRDQHLEQYQLGLVRGALGHRRELFRLVAAKLARTYELLVIDDFDLRDTQRSPAPEDTDTEIPAVKHQQTLVAPSVLRQVFVSAFSRAGSIVKVSAENVTRRCHACREINDWDRTKAGRLHTCTACGTTWDQDANACQNLLRERHAAIAAAAAARAAKGPNTAPKGRWAKAKAKKAARAQSVLATGAPTCQTSP